MATTYYSALNVLGYIDLNKNELRNAVLQNLGAAPGTPLEGQMYYDTVLDAPFFRNASAWVNMDPTQLSAVTGAFSATALAATGLTGATQVSRYVGATASGAPASGTFAIGDFVIARDGAIFICTVAGTPGTWVQIGGASFGSVTSQTSFGASSGNGAASTAARSDHTHGTPAHDAAAHSAIRISDLAAPTSDVSFGSRQIKLLSDPTAAQDAATKAYVDSVAAGLADFKASVRVAATSNGTLATAFENGDTVDGVTLATGDRILLAGQTTASERGIYVVQASGAPVRATDADASGDISVGTLVYVESGTANGGQQWICSATTATPWVPGSSGSTWVMFFAITATQAGAGLTASGNVLAVGAGTGISVGADAVNIDTAVVTRKYIPGTGPGTTTNTWVITHNFGNRDVHVSVYDATTYAEVFCDIVRTDTNTVTLNFASNVTLNTLRAVVIG